MFRILSVSLVVLLVPLTLLQLPSLNPRGALEPASATTVTPAESYEEVFDELMALEPTTCIAAVAGLTLTRDVGRFVLDSGRLHLLTPVQGRTVGAVFLGRGTFRFEPPIDIEREQLYRLRETRSLEQGFRVLFLLFADSTAAELERQLSFDDGEIDSDAAGHVEYALKYLSDKDRRYFNTDVMTPFLNGTTSDLFYAHLSEKQSDPLIFAIDPYEAEEVRLMRKSKARKAGETPEIVCQFHRQEVLRRGVEVDEHVNDLVHVEHYTIEGTIERDLDFSAAAELRITGRSDGEMWVPFVLYSRLEVDSAFWADGQPAMTFRWEKNSMLWVRFDEPVRPGERHVLRLYYHGDIVYERDDWYFLRTSSGWYPRHGTRNTATFDLTFHTPQRLEFVTVGERTMLGEGKDRMRTSRWVMKRPIRNAGFNLGEFEVTEVDYAGVPRTTVLMSRQGHSNLRTRYLTGVGMERDVASDVANSLSYFEKTFGKALDDHFYATEIPAFHGVAFPGIVHLSLVTFINKTEPEADQLFRAHEMAHQWWGIGVDYKTYRDRWLSEGMSQFAALLSSRALGRLRNVVLEGDVYEKTLKEWRKEIFERREKTGPIALGHRVQASDKDSDGDYQLIIYRKGAWVAHMIRSMMLDFSTLSDEPFLQMMREFYLAYRGKRASTENFEAVVTRHMGGDMKWFFDQWVRGTALPTYEVAHKIETDADGQYVVKLRIEQKDVPPEFQMIVPVFLEFQSGQGVFQIMVSGQVTTVDLPPVAEKPRKVTFNGGEAVLAQVKNVRWPN